MMVWIRVLPQGKRRDIDLPPAVAHRSGRGDALMIAPGQSQEITGAEWAYIQSQHPDLVEGIQVLGTSGA